MFVFQLASEAASGLYAAEDVSLTHKVLHAAEGSKKKRRRKRKAYA